MPTPFRGAAPRRLYRHFKFVQKAALHARCFAAYTNDPLFVGKPHKENARPREHLGPIDVEASSLLLDSLLFGSRSPILQHKLHRNFVTEGSAAQHLHEARASTAAGQNPLVRR